MTAEPTRANTLAGVLLDSCRQWPDKVAIKFPGFQWSYSDLAQEAMEIARGLKSIGVRRGDHVGILLPNGADFVRSFFGVALASAVGVTLNVRYRRSDLSYVIAKSNIRVLILSAEYRAHFNFEELVADLLQEGKFPLLEKVVVLGTDEAGSFIAESAFRKSGSDVSIDALQAEACRVSLRDPCSMLFTSGTTAFPKGCVLSHEAVVRTAAAWTRYGIHMTESDTIWIPNPLFHIGALTTLVASVACGSRFMSLPYFDADLAVDMLCQEEVTVFFPVFDTVAMPILDHPRASELKMDKVRYCFTIGNPMNIERMKAYLPDVQHINVYGMTETSGWCIFNLDMSEKGGPFGGGFSIPGVEFKLRYLDSAGTGGEQRIGEICIRSWCTLTEYYEEPEATAKAIDADGWFHTGDIGWVGEDGRLHFHGRLGEMLKVGGENVAPMELEVLIGSHEAVRHVAVVGVPDARLGQVPAAFIELKPGASFDAAQVIEFCRDQVARFKLPRHVRFVQASEWPMSATKIRKEDLRKQLAAELDASEKSGR